MKFFASMNVFSTGIENEKSSSDILVVTVNPVMSKKTPTPPMHPTRMCRGKNPMRRPSLRCPRSRNARPVRSEESAYAASVVATISASLFLPPHKACATLPTALPAEHVASNSALIPSTIPFAMIWKNGTTSIIMLPFAPAKPLPPAEYTTCATRAETKNMDTPAGMRFTVSGVPSKVDCIVECIMDPMESVDTRTPVNGGDAGKMSIPYERASRMLRRHPRRTAGRAARARDDVCLIEDGLKRVRVYATALETRVGFDLWGEEEEDVCAKIRPDSGSPPTA
jgi:hypothetical protein